MYGALGMCGPRNLPPGFVAVPLKGAVLVIPERVYVAGLKLGKTLRRQAELARRTSSSRSSESPPHTP